MKKDIRLQMTDTVIAKLKEHSREEGLTVSDVLETLAKAYNDGKFKKTKTTTLDIEF